MFKRGCESAVSPQFSTSFTPLAMLVSEPSESGGSVRGAGVTPVDTGGRLKTLGMRKRIMPRMMSLHTPRIKTTPQT